MASGAPKYYRPYYPSDSEESDASEDDIIQLAESLPDYVSFAQGLYRAAGPPFVTNDIDFNQNVLDRHTVYGPMVEGQEGYTVQTTTQQSDNVIVLQSLDRDKVLYPQPTNCQLMLPRTYVNVTRFEIVDISFIASFFYFRPDKYNTTFQIRETDRVLYSYDLTPTIVAPTLDLTTTIREGTYTIDTLLQEITTQLNTPPLFYDFINGYTDFYVNFLREGDYSLNFNYPGDYYYDSLRKTYIANPTMKQIVSYYFQQAYAIPTSLSTNNTYTDAQTKVAYYYPVVKELLLDSSSPAIVYNGVKLSSTTYSDYKNQLLYNFSGIDDPLMSGIIQNLSNIQILDAYRLAHTFRYHSINNYICSYGAQNTIVTIQATTLNTSLVTLLNTTYSNLLTTQIQRTGISLADYTNSVILITTYRSILSDMYNILQSNFAYHFGIDYGMLGNLYFLTLSNVVLIKNGRNATNVPYGYNNQQSPFISQNIDAVFKQSNISYWNMSNVNQLYSNTVLDTSLPVYNTRILTIQADHPFQTSNGIYINPVERSVDIMINVQPGAYTIIPISSKLRQTAQVETLPKPSIYLYPEWNYANRDTIGFNSATFSNGFYTYAMPSTAFSSLFPITDLGVISSNIVLNPFLLTLATTPTGISFSFTLPPANLSNAVGKYQVYLPIFPGRDPIPNQGPPVSDLSTNTFADTLAVFVYHDKAALFADIGPVGQSNGENPFFYKYTLTIPQGSAVQTIPFNGYEGETYYVYCRPKNKLAFSPILFTLSPFTYSVTPLACNVDFDPRLPTFNPYNEMRSNFFIAKVHDPDYIRLPIIDSNGYYYKSSILSCNIGFLPSASNITAPIDIPLIKPVFPLGYSSNVSDDLSDYIPILGTTPPRCYDPVNSYQFQYTVSSPYNPVTQRYQATLLNPDGSEYKESNTVPVRQSKIVQYTGSHYIPTITNAFTSNTTLHTFKNLPGVISPFDQHSPCGFLFLPEEGTWTLTRLTIMCQTATTNTHFLAIYPTSYLSFMNLKNIQLSKAICICVLVTSTTYTTPVTGSAGTYYTYSNVYSPLSNYVVAGKTQSTSNLITDTNAYYSAISYSFSNPAMLSNTTFAFTDFLSSSVTTLDNLTGPCIPYPDAGFFSSPIFYDGTPIPDANYTMILSSNMLFRISSNQPINPNTNCNFNYINHYTSQYAQSSPIVNAHLHYLKPDYQLADFYTYSNYFLSWYSVPDIPSRLCTTVNGTIMFQTGAFPIASYVTYQESTTFSLITTLTEDMLFTTEVLLAQSGNSTSYIFLGGTSNSLLFKEYVVATGQLNTYNRISTSNLLTTQIQTLLVKGGQWWLCYLTPSGVNIAYGSSLSSIDHTSVFAGTYTSAQIAFDSLYGRNLYLIFNTLSGSSTVYSSPIADGAPFPLTALKSYTIHSNTISISVQMIYGVEYIYSLVASNTYVYRFNTATQQTVQSAQNFQRQPLSCYSGLDNTLWVLFETSPYIMAFVFTVPSMHIAWQQLFPLMKIELNKVTDDRISIPDTFNLATPEWYHSMLFSYSDMAAMNADIYNRGSNAWGQETSFQTSDTSFQGYYFNAYLQDVPLQSNTSYITLRGFSPTESYQATLRISLPNVYDFGYVTFTDLINEIATLSNTTAYSLGYARQLSTFNGSFVRSGGDAYYGISSFSIPTTGFSNFMAQYSTIYGNYTNLKTGAETINTNLTSQMTTFISTHLQYTLPTTLLTRNRFTDALMFSMLWKTGLATTPPAYATLTDEWGIGWNLGFFKQDDDPSTVHTAPSMYKIIDDYLYLRLNPEFNLNRMSAGTKENYLDSREPSGLTSYYYCKLLLNGYGQKATTFIHAPVFFTPPIGKISKLSFQWIDSKGNLLNIPSATDSDWQMTVNIQENVQVSKFIQTTPVSASNFLQPHSEVPLSNV